MSDNAFPSEQPFSLTVWWSGNVGMLVGTIVPWMIMFVQGQSTWRLSLYALVAVCAFAVKFTNDFAMFFWPWLYSRLWLVLLLLGGIGLLLQTLSGNAYIQPVFFTVPLVYGAFVYSPRRNAFFAGFYLAMVALGLWVHGHETAWTILFTVLAYGAAMFFMDATTRLAVDQSRARGDADRLAADLARERDYLARLVQITATLTRELDLVPVLEQVAAAGGTLAQAGQARVWLREEMTDGEQEQSAVRLAAAVPSQRQQSPPTSVENVLLHASAASSGERLVLPLTFEGRTIGVLELADRTSAPFTTDEIALLQPFADAAAVAIEHARLYEQARLSATLAERNRIARELHDTIAQGLTAVTMQLDAAQRSFERDPGRARVRLGRAHTLARETLGDVRRSVWTLAAPLIDGQALGEALSDVATRFAERTGLPVRYTHHGPPPIVGHAAASQLVRIVQEALQNIEKHAQASEIAICSTVDATGLHITISDNGVGFIPEAVPFTTNGGGFGLVSIRERARLAGATVSLESAPGRGTVVTLAMPRLNE